MPFNLETFINDILNSTGVNSIVNNPIWVGIIITVIILIIIYFQFADSMDEEQSFWPVWIQTGVWILITTLSILFLHFKNVDNEYTKKGGDKQAQLVVQATTENIPDLNITGGAINPSDSTFISGAFKSGSTAPTLPAGPIVIDPNNPAMIQ